MGHTSPLIHHAVIAVPSLEDAAARFRALGFTLTPRAQHPWGTANQLVQLSGVNFIELLEVDRPELIPPHRPDARPPRFSFGAYNRDFLDACGRGFAMLALDSADTDGDVRRFADAGLDTYAPFHFERQATLPDGQSVKVAFSLAFVTDPRLPRAAFFTCHSRHPENFWKPQFQRHDNGAREMREAVLVAPAPEALAPFAAGLTGSQPQPVKGGIACACGSHALLVLTSEAYAARFGVPPPALDNGPRLAAIVIASTAFDRTRGAIPAAEACGVAIVWQPAD